MYLVYACISWFYQLPHGPAKVYRIAGRGARGRTGVFEGLTLRDAEFTKYTSSLSETLTKKSII